ncbi:universal stress protein [Actinacidiphila acididurans]|uniref:Universal stress protein n=1 Tax=Actinacidiphila acididurans TaxID=2784346 RepID=A0ABS2TYQ7_9ACTN|nr:universal stress protein [Actinacidiphila acididurans]MBM9507952.1 universal stress protein [Actinacidiphila acididurans]
MKQSLIIGIDGSDHSLRAVDWAVAEATRRDLPLRLVHGSLWERYEGVRPGFGTERPAEQVMAEHVVASAVERVEHIAPGLEVSSVIVPSDPVQALLREGQGAFAIVVGTRGRGTVAGMLLGSTGLEVAAHSPCPVIVVRGEPGRELSRVTLGIGDDGKSSAAIGFAFREAEIRDAELYAVHAWHHPADELPGTRPATAEVPEKYAQDAEQVLGGALLAAAQEFPKVDVRRATPEGRAHQALIEASTASDLLVVGARRRQGAAGAVGMQLGPVNHAVLHHAACPVAVVPQEQ